MQYRAGEGGTQTVAEERNLLSRTVWGYEVGGEGTQGRRLGQTEASDDRCDTMRIKSSLTRPTVRRRKPKGNKKRYNHSWSNGQTKLRKATVLRAFPVISYGRAKTVVERQNAAGISAGLK